MQQLTLFGNQTRTRRLSTKIRANARTRVASHEGWDLWSQETEREKEVALFFLDIRDFTPLAERHDAAHVLHIVKKLFSTFQNIIRVHHGRIIETSGDGFYAAFGLDRELTEAVNDAVVAGKVILKTLDRLNNVSFEKNLRQRIDVGIGIHAGGVATGNLAIGGRDHFVVMGYAVNVAARIQAATRQFNNNFLVSSSVFNALVSPPEGTKVSAQLKGLSDPVDLYLIGNSYHPDEHLNTCDRHGRPETGEPASGIRS